MCSSVLVLAEAMGSILPVAEVGHKSGIHDVALDHLQLAYK